MSDSARDEAERIAAPFDRGVACGILTRHSLADAIESALLAYGRRERAQGMREAVSIAVHCSWLESAIRGIERRADEIDPPEHRARETEGTK